MIEEQKVDEIAARIMKGDKTLTLAEIKKATDNLWLATQKLKAKKGNAVKNEQEVKEYDSEFWNPNPDDVLKGTVIEFSQMKTKFGVKKFMMIETPFNNKTIVFLTVILQSLITEKNVKVGDSLYVKFIGKTKAKGQGHDYNDYVLNVLQSNQTLT